MIRFKHLIATCLATLMLCFSGNTLAQAAELDAADAETLTYLRVFSKYMWDIYLGSGSQQGPIPEEPILLALAKYEKRRLDTLGYLLDYYGVEDPVVSDEIWVIPEGFLSEDLINRAFFVGWSLRPGQFENCAYLEEMKIRDLRQAIAETDESVLSEAYTEMLGESYSNLVLLAAWLHEDPARYTAQLLEQGDVDQIIASNDPTAIGEFFVINAGLNDAWFDPTTNGQGFTLSVYEDKGTVFLAWFTFDTELPAFTASANLGDPGQRWLTAQGPYVGRQAELTVYSSGPGLFAASTPVPELTSIGSVTLQFEDCYTGTVTYDLPGIGRSGSIPIQRVATDNVCHCMESGLVTE